MIVIKPQGGLANRIRVISSALNLSKLSNQTLSVIWEPDQDLNCSFPLLFEETEYFKVIDQLQIQISAPYEQSLFS